MSHFDELRKRFYHRSLAISLKQIKTRNVFTHQGYESVGADNHGNILMNRKFPGAGEDTLVIIDVSGEYKTAN